MPHRCPRRHTGLPKKTRVMIFSQACQKLSQTFCPVSSRPYPPSSAVPPKPLLGEGLRNTWQNQSASSAHTVHTLLLSVHTQCAHVPLSDVPCSRLEDTIPSPVRPSPVRLSPVLASLPPPHVHYPSILSNLILQLCVHPKLSPPTGLLAQYVSSLSSNLPLALVQVIFPTLESPPACRACWPLLALCLPYMAAGQSSPSLMVQRATCAKPA